MKNLQKIISFLIVILTITSCKKECSSFYKCYDEFEICLGVDCDEYKLVMDSVGSDFGPPIYLHFISKGPFKFELSIFMDSISYMPSGYFVSRPLFYYEESKQRAIRNEFTKFMNLVKFDWHNSEAASIHTIEYGIENVVTEIKIKESFAVNILLTNHSKFDTKIDFWEINKKLLEEIQITNKN